MKILWQYLKYFSRYSHFIYKPHYKPCFCFPLIFHSFFFLVFNNIGYRTLRSTTFLLFDLDYWYLACIFINLSDLNVHGNFAHVTLTFNPKVKLLTVIWNYCVLQCCRICSYKCHCLAGSKPFMVEIFGMVFGCGSLDLDLSRLYCSDDALSLQFYYTWMLGTDEKVMVVSNMFQWL